MFIIIPTTRTLCIPESTVTADTIEMLLLYVAGDIQQLSERFRNENPNLPYGLERLEEIHQGVPADTIRHIKLINKRIDDATLAQLCEVLPQFVGLETLDLANNQISEKRKKTSS